MNMLKLFSKDQSLFKTTEITQANPRKSAAFTIVTIGSNWICLFSETHEIIFKVAHGIGFMAFFFFETLKKIAKMNNFIFNTDIWHILTCLHTKVVLLTTATFFKCAMNHCIPFPFFHAPLPLSYLQRFC